MSTLCPVCQLCHTLPSKTAITAQMVLLIRRLCRSLSVSISLSLF
jgi:hypothetical protein